MFSGSKGDFKSGLSESKSIANPTADNLIDEIYRETPKYTSQKDDKEAELIIKNYAKPLVIAAYNAWDDLSVTQISADKAIEKWIGAFELSGNKQVTPTSQQFQRICEMARYGEKGVKLRQFVRFVVSAGNPQCPSMIDAPIGASIDFIYTHFYLRLNKEDKARFADSIFPTKEAVLKSIIGNNLQSLFWIGWGAIDIPGDFISLHPRSLSLNVTICPSIKAPDRTYLLTAMNNKELSFCEPVDEEGSTATCKYVYHKDLSFLNEFCKKVSTLLLKGAISADIPIETRLTGRWLPHRRPLIQIVELNKNKLKSDYPELFVPYVAPDMKETKETKKASSSALIGQSVFPKSPLDSLMGALIEAQLTEGEIAELFIALGTVKENRKQPVRAPSGPAVS